MTAADGAPSPAADHPPIDCCALSPEGEHTVVCRFYEPPLTMRELRNVRALLGERGW